MAFAKTQAAVSSAKSALTPDQKKPYAAIIAVVVGYLILLALLWTGILIFAEKRAVADAQYRAQNWSDQLVRKLVFVEQTFESGEMQIYDKNVIASIPQDKEVYRYSLTQANGRIFWSSNKYLVGKAIDQKLLQQAKEAGKNVSVLLDIPAEKIDNLAFYTNNNGERIQQVSIMVKPIFYHKKFVGSIVVYTNLSTTITWLQSNARNVARAISVLLAIIFAGIGSMIWQFAKARGKQVIELQASELEAVEMADQLKEMNEDIIDLNADLKDSMTTLRQTQDEVIRKGKMAQLGQLTATVAHDIRNPLGTVRTSTFLLRRKFIEDNPTMEKPLARIEKGVERCDGIITELLDFTRSKNLNLKLQSVDDWLIGILKDQLQSLPEEVAIEVHCGLKDQEINFDGDSLTRALVNFLSNASEAMVGKGAEKPLVPTANPKIVISTALSNRGVEVSVSDNGPGISSENIEKILDPLFTTKSFGVGLGLPAVEKIFEQHGGGLEVVSVEGEGATFTGWISPVLSNDMEENQKAA